jgi:hypothetical protein
VRWRVAVAGLTVIGVAMRLQVAGQTLFGDELSTYYIVANNGLGGVIATVHGNAEITPPLGFVAAWLTTRLGLTPELLRAPFLVAGTAAIPLTYTLAKRTVGRSAGLVAAAITAFAPYMILSSAEARGYQLMIVLVVLSTLAMLSGIGDGRRRWWVAYAAISCAAVYTHYTAVFALGAQLVWLLWAHPEARRSAILANAAAALGFLPWLSGFLNDLRSPTTAILAALRGSFTLDNARVALEHWSIGYPYALPTTTLHELPGDLALGMLGAGLVLAIAGVAFSWARARPRLSREFALIAAVALSAPVVAGAMSLLGVTAVSTGTAAPRTLAASWPATAIAVSALVTAAGRRLSLVATALVVASFVIGGTRMLEPRFQFPDYEAASRYVDRQAASRDVVVDASGVSPAPITILDVTLDRPHRLLAARSGYAMYRPFRLVTRVPTPSEVGRRAGADASVQGGRVFVVSSDSPALGATLRTGGRFGAQVSAAIGRRFRRVATRRYPGIITTTVAVFAARPSRRG